MKNKKTRKKVIKIIAVIVAAAMVIAGAGLVLLGKARSAQAQKAAAGSVRSYEAKYGTISTTVSGTGTLEADDVENIDLLSLVEVDTVYVKAGDTVQEGDLLASVDPVSVTTALKTLQEQVDELDDQIKDEQGETISSSIKSGLSGRVKKIYATEGDRVTEVMEKSSALLLLSLDGKMALDIEASSGLSAGDEVTVTLSDGTEKDGTVESIQGNKAVITVTDNGPAYEEEVTVSKDEKKLGSGKLYIHSELAVTGYTGTISKVSVKENSKVSDGTVLFKLTDLPNTAEYEKLVAERAEVADALSQIVALYSNPNLYADFSGTVQSVNCENAEYVESEKSSASAGSEAENTEEKNAGSESSAGAPQDKEITQSAGGNRQTGMNGISGGLISLGMTSSSHCADVIRTTASVSSNGEEAAADTPSGNVNQDSQSETPETVTGGTEENGSGSVPESGEKDAGKEESPEPVKEAIAALQLITVTAPVTGNTVQTTVDDAAQYSASIGWTPTVTGTYAADTAYTAAVILRAKDGYYFDSELVSVYEKAVTAQGAALCLEISSAQDVLTITAAFPATEAKKAQEDTNTQKETQNTNTAPAASAGAGMAGAGSGASKGSSAGYTVSSASGSSTASDEQEEKLSTYTETTAVFTVSRDERMCVKVSVDEQDILNLSRGQQAEVTLDAIDGETFEGTVTSINTISEEATNGVTKYTAEVSIGKTQEMLQGMNASVVVTVSSSENCLMIPEAALNENGRSVTVYTNYDESTGEYGGETEVTTGVSDGTSVEILSGLSEGDTVYYSYTEKENSGFGFNFGTQPMMQGGNREQMRGSGSGKTNMPQQ